MRVTRGSNSFSFCYSNLNQVQKLQPQTKTTQALTKHSSVTKKTKHKPTQAFAL